ncbi:MAG: LacI family DNA-binding transcriptional regulator [Luteolibacter sp.]|uniref:LacI family DNA-binding transcriptional regulator n=1 Tax=Luteolibacter sp. TaxID=1962973 RepID=UPI003264B3C1
MEQDPVPARVSLRDIGRILGVSHVTVSLALRDNPRISKKVREKIRKAAVEMGYQPDPMLAALAQYRKGKSTAPITAAIAWINTWNPPEGLRKYLEFNAYWEGASKAATKFGYRLEEFRLGDGCTPGRLNQILTARGIVGILLPPQRPHPDWGDFPWENYSVVRFGRSLKSPGTHIVTADQVANTLLAFRKIQERGYKRIGFITHEGDIFERGHLFEAGYLMAQRGVPEKQRIPICTIGNGPRTGRVETVLAWKKKYKPDAVFTDMSETPDILKRAGIRVPEDIGLAVTTVLDSTADAGINQNPEEIGRVGLLMLNSLINDGARGVPTIFRQNLVEGVWVDGSTLPDRN